MTDTTTAWLLVTALGLVAFVVYLLAENAPTIRAWVDRDPVRLDSADRCGRPGCDVNHRGQR